nr:cop9 signalosome complex subunit 4 [Quercus suber]
MCRSIVTKDNSPVITIMASPTVTQQLDQLSRSTLSTTQRAEAYEKLLASIVSTPDNTSDNLVAYVRSILSDSIGVIHSRPLLSSFIEQYRSISDDDLRIEAGTSIADILAPKIVSYETQDSELKFLLADAHEAKEDYTSSAKTLQTITLDSSQRSVTADERAKVWMRICRCYLEEDDHMNALTYLNKVKQVIFDISDRTTRLQFQLSQARISDSQRHFLDASASYLQLSTETIIDEEERLQALSAAITCAVLAPAGPLRARQLGKLYRDERASDTAEYAILEKIFLDRLLAPLEVQAFAAGLAEHQLAKTSDGSTVLDKAVLEHNLLAASRLYANIALASLGTLLGVDADRAETYAATMIQTKRLSGSIDQIEGYIYFNTKEGASDVGRDLRQWENNVQGLAEEVEKVTTMLQREEATWVHRASDIRSIEATVQQTWSPNNQFEFAMIAQCPQPMAGPWRYILLRRLRNTSSKLRHQRRRRQQFCCLRRSCYHTTVQLEIVNPIRPIRRRSCQKSISHQSRNSKTKYHPRLCWQKNFRFSRGQRHQLGNDRSTRGQWSSRNLTAYHLHHAEYFLFSNQDSDSPQKLNNMPPSRPTAISSATTFTSRSSKNMPGRTLSSNSSNDDGSDAGGSPRRRSSLSAAVEKAKARFSRRPSGAESLAGGEEEYERQNAQRIGKQEEEGRRTALRVNKEWSEVPQSPRQDPRKSNVTNRPLYSGGQDNSTGRDRRFQRQCFEYARQYSSGTQSALAEADVKIVERVRKVYMVRGTEEVRRDDKRVVEARKLAKPVPSPQRRVATSHLATGTGPTSMLL